MKIRKSKGQEWSFCRGNKGATEGFGFVKGLLKNLHSPTSVSRVVTADTALSTSLLGHFSG